MGLLDNFTGDDTELIDVQKYDVSTTMNLMRIIDWEAQVILYTDTTREGYTSVPFSEANISADDAPENVKRILDSQK
ncbi:hypothetical protein [Haloquadratum walsbyi]|jgi:hypothetical protein|uniref:Uncharacterized protein n=1 Tax=Haloquadratum walsbyi (strain DSM 16854 / JCM 12705 / C23) TaxID=768065 RepID=G0LNE2_HALWC|nr:hypothetical protein [Haloquadratum walsbyi]CCC41948.1 uncharacterized protein Hqrw_5076 [Haloquadratum walsbyi C23]